jgi:hypothetical protein
MCRTLGLTATILLLVLPMVAGAQTNGRDYEPFTRIDGFDITSYSDHRFDSSNFVTDESGKQTRVEGRRIQIEYRAKDSQSYISELELKRTLESQANSVKADILYDKAEGSCNSDEEMFVARVQHNGIPVWIAFSCSGQSDAVRWIGVNVIEERPFHPATRPD